MTISLYDFPDWQKSPKFEEFQDRVNCDLASLLGNLLLLWRWYIENNGDVTLKRYDLEMFADWRPINFMAALIKSGYVETKKGGKFVLVAADPLLEKMRVQKLARERARRRRAFRPKGSKVLKP